MKKRICIVLIAIALLVPSFAFAQMFDVSLGATAQVVASYDNFDFGETFGKIDNYSFGPELRLKLTVLEINAVGLYSSQKSGGFNVNVLSFLPTVGLSFDIVDTVRLGLGMGPMMFWGFVNGHQISDMSFGDKFMAANFRYRATVDFMAGPVLVGVNYSVPTTFNIKTHDAKGLKPDFSTGMIGVSVLYSFF
ncbi:MAG: hypothetical protein SPD11_11970 [Sphaerochaetaceae bacterium]|nr:hypothetical protein [Sphaerochaetaceae bacterium]